MYIMLHTLSLLYVVTGLINKGWNFFYLYFCEYTPDDSLTHSQHITEKSETQAHNTSNSLYTYIISNTLLILLEIVCSWTVIVLPSDGAVVTAEEQPVVWMSCCNLSLITSLFIRALPCRINHLLLTYQCLCLYWYNSMHMGRQL